MKAQRSRMFFSQINSITDDRRMVAKRVLEARIVRWCAPWFAADSATLLRNL